MKYVMSLFVILLVSGSAMAQDAEISKAYTESYKYEKSGNYFDAYRALVPVYEKYQQTYTVNLRLGWLSALMGKYKEAVKHYEQAESTAPYSLEVKTNLTAVYLAREEWTKAEEKCYSILTIDYYNFYANQYLISSYKAQGKYAEAEAVARKMLYVYPTNVAFLTELGVIRFALAEKTEATQIFENILILDPENVTAKKYLSEK